MVTTMGDRRAERVLTLRCGYCGDPFTPSRRHQRFCRPSCRVAHFKGRGEQRRLPLEEADALARVPFE